MEQAREAANTIKNIHPEFSLKTFADNHPYQDRKLIDQILTHLNQAELPSL